MILLVNILDGVTSPRSPGLLISTDDEIGRTSERKSEQSHKKIRNKTIFIIEMLRMAWVREDTRQMKLKTR